MTPPHAVRTIDTPVGPLTLTAHDGALSGVYFDGHDPAPRQALGTDRVGEPSSADDAVLDRASGQLAEYFAGTRRDFDLPLELAGTEFQRAVWAQLRAIPYGETITYGELARRVGNPNAFRAVGSANGRNPVSIVVPCHRVVAAGGKLGGYGGGLDRKTLLLHLEGAEQTLL